MNLCFVGAAAAVLLLSGCTDADWTRTMSYVGLNQAPPAVVEAAPAQAAPPPVPGAPNSWCLAVAANDKNEAAANGFDNATQQRRFTTSYTECSALFGTTS